MNSANSELPTPVSQFGFEPGMDRKLISYADMLLYFDRLAELSPYLRVETIGKSIEDRPLVALFISSASNMARLDELQLIQEQLNDPRGLDSEGRTALEDKARGIVLVTLGVHPAEIASSQTAPILVYDLLTRQDPEAIRIRDNTVVIIVPSVNPDGFDLVYNWYEKTLGTTAEGTWPPSITQKYAGGENNRDWFLLTQPEQRSIVERIFRRWHPHLGIDHHQMEENSFRYFVPPYTDPINPNIDPAIQAATSSAGLRIAADLTAAGLAGVTTGIFFSQYSPATAYAPYHGGVHLLTESASCRLATPIEVPADQLVEFHGANPTVSRVNHPLPWRGGRWGMREIIDYNMVATLSAIDDVASNRAKWVRRQTDVKMRACTASPNTTFLISVDWTDSRRSDELVKVLIQGGIEVHRALEEFRALGRDFDKGTFIVRLDQPASAYAKVLLQDQPYPLSSSGRNNEVKRPYDVIVHNLPLFFGVDCNRTEERLHVRTALVTEQDCQSSIATVPAAGTVVLSSRSNGSVHAANLLMDKGAKVRRVMKGTGSWPAGSYVIDAAADLIADAMRQTQTCFELATKRIESAAEPLKRPRLGVYRSWLTGFAACDEGWLRYVLDGHGFVYSSLRNRDLSREDLAQQFDAIILPQYLPGDLIFGHDPYSFAGATPHQRNRTVDDGAASKPLGDYPEEYAEGIGEHGMAGLKRFVEDGGTLIAIDTSSDAVIRYLDLPVTNALDGLTDQQFYNPGSVMRVQVDPNDPLCFGYENEADIIFVNSPAFAVSGNAQAVATYGGEDVLRAGWMVGGERVAGKAALVRVPYKRGQVILFGFRPHFRGQMRTSYRFLFNAIFSARR